MIKKRIIPCLDVKDGRVVKGVNFVGLRDVGNPVELAKRYNAENADELVFLDISKTQDGHDLMLDVIRETAKELFIPLTIGGGIKSVNDIRQLLNAGADKVSINSAAINNPELIREAADTFGSQCICVAIDVKYDKERGDYYVHTHGGSKSTDIKAFDWVKRTAELGAGELLITSMDHDGVKEGFDIKFLKEAVGLVDIPIIASGGAGNIDHFVELFKETDISAGLAASIFHNQEVGINDLKETLDEEGIEVRLS
ncbi:imidazole glycerol phosphate synthase subunit HisF [Salinicoccus halitifaciens]|uniref:Imidazole glycerol phosphate synthase subunit HisF n=1 Tax=Salinicoccus halitifaciens TaxID=1073415 RepID=A0ABV2EAL3_9STAP|nr:imidazole glycerol phosphate synthase subunit HisF [Salinicoccus halitifaciens]MCD2138596.1 imidazole glycerol phosphate synthase subunit HisF [Salinicoccus halitifaciens]